MKTSIERLLIGLGGLARLYIIVTSKNARVSSDPRVLSLGVRAIGELRRAAVAVFVLFVSAILGVFGFVLMSSSLLSNFEIYGNFFAQPFEPLFLYSLSLMAIAVSGCFLVLRQMYWLKSFGLNEKIQDILSRQKKDVIKKAPAKVAIAELKSDVKRAGTELTLNQDALESLVRQAVADTLESLINETKAKLRAEKNNKKAA